MWLRVALLLCLWPWMAGAAGCPDDPVEAAQILAAVNAERATARRAALRGSDDLRDAAQFHACDMARRGYFSHRSPDGRGLSERLESAGYRACRGAENIAKGQMNGHAAVSGWMRSDGHRRNILLRDVAEAGIGIAQSADGPIYVLLLGRRCD